jgi:hypothetical protein
MKSNAKAQKHRDKAQKKGSKDILRIRKKEAE